MSVELIIAPAASGKTQSCLQHIQNVRQTNPLSTIWVLVPNAPNVAYFRKRLAGSGGGLGIHVGTFTRLITDLLERQGNFTPSLTPTLSYRLLHEVIDEVFRKGELNYYTSIKDKPGFIEVIQNSFNELRSAFISPITFLEYTQGSSPAKAELASLYACFVNKLDNIGYIDPIGQTWLAITALESDPQAASHIQLLIVDGFTTINHARMQLLKRLSTQVGEMMITLTGEKSASRTIHRRTHPVVDELQRELSPQVAQLTVPTRLPPPIKHLEANILNPGDTQKFHAQSPIFIEAQTQREEVREALRWIKARNQRDGVPLANCAVFVADLKVYRPVLQAAAAEFGLSLTFSHPDRLRNSLAIQSLINLLDLPLENFSTRGLFNTLHSPYFSFGFENDDLELLEFISQKVRIVEGRNQWDEAWEVLNTTHQEGEEVYDNDRQIRDPLRHVDLSGLKLRLNTIWHVFDEITGIKSLTEWVSWLETTLTELNYFDHLSDEPDNEIIHLLGEVFKSLTLTEQVLSSYSMNYQQFLSELMGAIQTHRIEEPRQARRHSVYVTSLDRALGVRYQAVALLGFSEGLFPAVENPDPFLDELTRQNLGMDLLLGREQASTFYQAFTRSNQHLLITRPYLTESGESWEASPYWSAAIKLFNKGELKISPNKLRPQADAASPQELLFWAVQHNKLDYQHDQDLSQAWADLAFGRAILNARRTKQPHGAYEGDTRSISAQLESIYTSDHVWSASRLETYSTCPYWFYVQNVLKLEPKEIPELGLDSAQVGSIHHEILEKVFTGVPDPTDVEALLATLEDRASSVFIHAPRKYSFRPSPLWEVEKDQFIKALTKTITVLHERSLGWIPSYFEQRFGIYDSPTLQIDIGNEKVQVRGIIDRADVNAKGEVRVIDYKTGGSFLANQDLISGRRLQLPIYALAAQEALSLGTVVEGFYWKITAAEESSMKLSKFKHEYLTGTEAAYSTLISHIKHHLVGIRDGKFHPTPPKGGCPSYCPAVGWCWRYQAGFSQKR